DCCDDVAAETADAAFGDAWLPRYMSAGTNVAVVRHPVLLDLLREARADGRLHLEELSAAEAGQSQNAGLRHRREGLAYRLWLEKERGAWTPTKRVAPDRNAMSGPSRKVQRLRLRMADESPAAFEAARQAGSFD